MAGEGIVFAQDFPKYVAKELIRRQEIVRRSNIAKNQTDKDLFKDMSTYNRYKKEDLEFLLGKMSFIRLTSNAVPKQWPPRKRDVMGNEYIIPNWENDGKNNTAQYSWNPEDDPRTITKYDIRKETILYGGNLLFKKGANGVDYFMRPRAGFEEVYGPRSYGTIENYQLGTSGDFNQQIMSASYGDDINKAYKNDNKQFKPMPGILGISVSFKTQFIRSATIKWQCHSWDDFEVYERLYLTPGISVFLEWGWTTIDTPLPVLDFSYDYHKPREYFKKLMNKIMASKGRYDAMVGVINNFNWTVSGGVIECTTEIMSPATLLAQSSIIDPELKKAKGKKKTLKDVINELESVPVNEPYNISEVTSGVVKNVSPDATTIKIYQYVWGNKDKDNTGRYISWGDFEKILTAYVSPASLSESMIKDGTTTENETNPTDINNTDDGNLFVIKSADFAVNNNATTAENISYWSNHKTIGNNMYLCSCDPKICILPGQLFLENPVFDDLKDLPQIEKSDVPEVFYKNAVGFNSDTTNNRSVGILNNLLVNVEFIKEQLSGAENLSNLLTKKIYKGIQDACGNFYQFEFIQSIYDPFVMQTNDRQQSVSEATAMLFKARGNDSIVKTITVTGEIPQALGSQLWIRANAPDEFDPSGDKTIFSRDGYIDGFLGRMDSGIKKPTKEIWNQLDGNQKKTLADKFKMTEEEFTKSYEPQTFGTSGSSGSSGSSGTTEANTSNVATEGTTTSDVLEVSASTEEDEDKNKPIHIIFQNKIIRFYQALRFVYQSYSKEHVETARARLVQLLYTYTKLLESGTFDNRLLPIKLNLSIDGISGILYNQAMTTNLLPQRYFPNVLFRIFEIGSEVNSSGWTTTLGGTMSITPINYKIWMKKTQESTQTTETSSNTSEITTDFDIDAVSVKLYDKFRKILDKLNYKTIRNAVMSDKGYKNVKLKSTETQTTTTTTQAENTTGTNTGGTKNSSNNKTATKKDSGIIEVAVFNLSGNTISVKATVRAAAMVDLWVKSPNGVSQKSPDSPKTTSGKGTVTLSWTVNNAPSGKYTFNVYGKENRNWQWSANKEQTVALADSNLEWVTTYTNTPTTSNNKTQIKGTTTATNIPTSNMTQNTKVNPNLNKYGEVPEVKK